MSKTVLMGRGGVETILFLLTVALTAIVLSDKNIFNSGDASSGIAWRVSCVVVRINDLAVFGKKDSCHEP